MAQLNEELLTKELSSKTPKGVYFLYGNDSYLKEYYAEKISSASYSGDPFFNLQKFQGDCDLQDVYDAVKQFPMMSDSKCVVLYDYDFIKCDKQDFDKLCKIIEETEDGCVLLLRFDFLEFDIKRDSRAKKLDSVVDLAGGKTVCLNHRTREKLARMLVTGAKKRDVTLSEKDAFYIVEKVGDDLNILRNELEKLCSYCKDGTVTKEIIDNVLIGSVSASVYDYVDAIVKGDVSLALSLLDKMLYMRIEPLNILFMVSSVYIDMYRVYCAKKSGIANKEIAKDFSYGNRTFVLDRAERNLKKFTLNKLNESFNCITETDKMLKSFSSNERLALEKLTVKLNSIIWG